MYEYIECPNPKCENPAVEVNVAALDLDLNDEDGTVEVECDECGREITVEWRVYFNVSVK